MLTINSETQGNYLVIALTGRVDASNAKTLEEQAIGLIKDSNVNLILNLTDVNYISSAALRVFLLIAKELSKVNGTIKLCGLSSTLQDVFDISGFSKLFVITATLEEAL
jgi:anti-anti-sigma factor